MNIIGIVIAQRQTTIGKVDFLRWAGKVPLHDSWSASRALPDFGSGSKKQGRDSYWWWSHRCLYAGAGASLQKCAALPEWVRWGVGVSFYHEMLGAPTSDFFVFFVVPEIAATPGSRRIFSTLVPASLGTLPVFHSQCSSKPIGNDLPGCRFAIARALRVANSQLPAQLGRG